MRLGSIAQAAVLLAWIVPAADAAAPTPVETPPEEPVILVEDPGEDDLLMNRERYFYSSFGQRDPFASLLTGRFSSTGVDDLLDVGEITLVGVMWGEDDKFGLVQDTRDRAYMLRVGDRVVNGKVIEITQTSLTVQHYFFGETANITIHMSQGDGDDEKP